MDDMAVVDAKHTHAIIAAAPGMGHDMSGAEEGLDPVGVDMDPQALADGSCHVNAETLHDGLAERFKRCRSPTARHR